MDDAVGGFAASVGRRLSAFYGWLSVVALRLPGNSDTEWDSGTLCAQHVSGKTIQKCDIGNIGGSLYRLDLLWSGRLRGSGGNPVSAAKAVQLRQGG